MKTVAPGAKARVAVVGAWSMANRVHYPSLASFDDVTIAGICVEAEHEDKGYLFADGDTKGVVYDTREVAGSHETYIFGGFQAKHREFIDCLRTGKQPGSHFGDALKTMEVAEKILAQSLLGL